LIKAKDTAFGERYNFNHILRQNDIISSYQMSVPIHDYNKIFKNWWYRALHGEAFVTWPSKIHYFALSSGSPDSPSKHIPVTEDMLKSIKKASIRQIISLAKYDLPKDFYQKGILMLGGSTHLQYNGTYYEGDLSGITIKNIPFWFQHFYKPGKRISKERDWNTKLEEITKNAKKWDIGIIVGVPAWIQILLQKIIDYYKVNNIHEIWPNLKVYAHGGVSFEPYINNFEKLLGKPIYYIETYLTSEGFIAYQNRPNSKSMKLILNNGIFMEFVPFNDKNFDNNGNIYEDAEILTIKDIKENEEYALILSTCSGVWRYITGDTIKFTSKELNEIIITGKTIQYLNISGEHLSIENMDRAIKIIEEELNIEIPEYTVAGIKNESMFAHKWFIATNKPIDTKKIEELLDHILKILNDDYNVERMVAINNIIVEIVPLEFFHKWQNDKFKSTKMPRVLNEINYKEWIEFLNMQKKL
jgi:hypothetical protein